MNNLTSIITYLLKISLRIMLFFGLDDISKMVNQVQLPRVFLINFLHKHTNQKQKTKRESFLYFILGGGLFYVFAGEFDAVLEQVDDLLFVEAGIGVGLKGLIEGEALAADGGGACVACLGAFELVVVGAQDEGAGRGQDAEPLLLIHRGVGA